MNFSILEKILHIKVNSSGHAPTPLSGLDLSVFLDSNFVFTRTGMYQTPISDIWFILDTVLSEEVFENELEL